MANIDDAFRVEVLSFDDTVLIAQGNFNPSTGIGYEAPRGSLFLRVGGEIWIKTNNPDVGWSRVLDTSAVLDSLANVNVTSPSTGDLLTYNGTSWVNLQPDTTEIDNIEIASGGIFTPTGIFDGTAVDAALINVTGSTDLLNALSQIDAAISAAAGIDTLDELTDTTITTPINGNVLTFQGGSWVNAAPSGGGGGLYHKYDFFADQVEYTTSSDWAISNGAPASADSINPSLTVRLFDDSINEGIGFIVSVPVGATNMVIRTKARAATLPVSPSAALVRLHTRNIAHDTAVASWNTSTLVTINLPTNENFQYDETPNSLASWGIIPGEVYQMQFSRFASSVLDNLVGDLSLLLVEVEFS